MSDAYVVGSGPNGLAAAIVLARAGWSVKVLEAAASAGGGCRSAELTLPGFLHDTCSAIHPLAVLSPLLSSLPLAAHGLEWIEPDAPLAHPLDHGPPVMLERSLERTAAGLGDDRAAYRRLLAPLVADAHPLVAELLAAPFHLPRRPLLLARFLKDGIGSAERLARRFSGTRARALLAGIAAHSMLPLERAPSAAFALLLAVAAHAVSWPLPRGGAGKIAGALIACLRGLGGRLELERPLRSLAEIDGARAVLLDVTPRQLLALAGDRLRAPARRALGRFRYGPGVFKLDLALAGAIPWRDRDCARAATVHLGGELEEIAAGERLVWEGRVPARPFVILSQPTLFDPSRAPAGAHIAWAYCHVPPGSALDLTAAIEAQIERFAPGFKRLVIGRRAATAIDMERRNPNLIGGDINGGVQDLAQVLARPRLALRPWRTALRGVYLCSSSTPPGGGVHGMCGALAARTALADARRT